MVVWGGEMSPLCNHVETHSREPLCCVITALSSAKSWGRGRLTSKGQDPESFRGNYFKTKQGRSEKTIDRGALTRN